MREAVEKAFSEEIERLAGAINDLILELWSGIAAEESKVTDTAAAAAAAAAAAVVVVVVVVVVACSIKSPSECAPW